MRGQLRAKRDVSGLGIEPEVELVPGIVGELRIARLWTQAAAHDHDALREFGECGSIEIAKRNIRERASGVDRNLMRMRMNLTNEKVRSILRQRLQRRLASSIFGTT